MTTSANQPRADHGNRRNFWLRTSLFVWIICVALAAFWDYLFWGRVMGASTAAFTATICLILIVRAPDLWKNAQGRLIAAITLLAVLSLVEEPSWLAILMTLVAVGTLILISQRDLSLLHDTATAWFVRWLALLSTLWFRIFRDNVIAARWFARHPRMVGRVMPMMRALAWWVFPLLAGALFVGLFALANPVISLFFSKIWDHVLLAIDWVSQLAFTRMFLWVVVIVVAYGLLRRRHTWKKQVQPPPVMMGDPSWEWLTGPQMIVRLLIVMNIIFALENALDAAYLCFGVPLPDHLSYMEYAHRGAYTLIATALLAGIFTLASFREGGTAYRSKVCRWLVYLWIGQNILLLVSTIWRVWVFVQTTELTRLRISTMVWCGIVAAGFVWIILRIKNHKPNVWLWRMNAFTALGILFICAFMNFDGIVADYNVRHCAESGGGGQRLDIDYLEHLGERSVPALVWMREHPGTLSATDRIRIFDAEITLRHELESDLNDWRSWTFRRWRSAGGTTAEAVARLRGAIRRLAPALWVFEGE